MDLVIFIPLVEQLDLQSEIWFYSRGSLSEISQQRLELQSSHLLPEDWNPIKLQTTEPDILLSCPAANNPQRNSCTTMRMEVQVT